MHGHLLDVVGAGARPSCVVQWVGEALCHAVNWAAVQVDRGLRPGVCSGPRTSSHVLFVEPVLVRGGQTVAGCSSVHGGVGPQQDGQLVAVRSRVGVHHSVWTSLAKGILGGPTLRRRGALVVLVMARCWNGTQACKGAERGGTHRVSAGPVWLQRQGVDTMSLAAIRGYRQGEGQECDSKVRL